eukprot:7075865-Pyramimonas_sp.AAC.1
MHRGVQRRRHYGVQRGAQRRRHRPDLPLVRAPRATQTRVTHGRTSSARSSDPFPERIVRVPN